MKRPRAVAARLPAEPGWRALLFARDDDGDLFHTRMVIVPITTWGLSIDVAIWNHPSEGPVPRRHLGALVPLDAEGDEIQPRFEGGPLLGLIPPHETNEEALARFSAAYGETFEILAPPIPSAPARPPLDDGMGDPRPETAPIEEPRPSPLAASVRRG